MVSNQALTCTTRPFGICQRLCKLITKHMMKNLIRIEQVGGLKESLGLTGNQYSILLSMFTAG